MTSIRLVATAHSTTQGREPPLSRPISKEKEQLLHKDMTAAKQMCGWVNDAMRDGLYIVKVRDGWMDYFATFLIGAPCALIGLPAMAGACFSSVAIV